MKKTATIRLGGAWKELDDERNNFISEINSLKHEHQIEIHRVRNLELRLGNSLDNEVELQNRLAAYERENSHLKRRLITELAANAGCHRLYYSVSNELFGVQSDKLQLESRLGCITQRCNELELRLEESKHNLAIQTEENERLCNMAYVAEEQRDTIDSKLVIESGRSTILEKSRNQKEKHVVLLVKEKERLHRQVASLRVLLKKSGRRVGMEDEVDSDFSVDKKDNSWTNPTTSHGSVRTPKYQRRVLGDSSHGNVSCGPVDSPNPTRCPGGRGGGGGGGGTRKADIHALATIRGLNSQLEGAHADLAAEREASVGLRKENEELLQRFRAASRARDRVEKKLALIKQQQEESCITRK